MKFTIDDVQYDVFVEALSREAKIKDGKNSSSTLSGLYKRDVIGTFYSYKMDIATNQPDTEQYDRLYEVLTAPQNEPHIVTLPYGQSALTFNAYITSVSDEIKAKRENGTLWGGLSITFEAERPQRVPE